MSEKTPPAQRPVPRPESGAAAAPAAGAAEESGASAPAQEMPPSWPPASEQSRGDSHSAQDAHTRPGLASADDDFDEDYEDEEIEPGAPRRVRLTLARVDPWSVMKISFLLSLALGIMLVVAAWIFWMALNNMGVFTSVDELIRKIVGSESELNVLQYVERDKIVSVAMLIAVADVILLTALGTIGAFLYNVTAALVGGVTVTLTDD